MRKFAHTDGDLVLTGDENTPAMPVTEAEVNHLRRLLAWMRCEWMLDEDMQGGYVSGAAACVQIGAATPEQAGAVLMERAEKIEQVPAYVRQAVKMLTKALRDHEKERGIFDSQAAQTQAPNASVTGGSAAKNGDSDEH